MIYFIQLISISIGLFSCKPNNSESSNSNQMSESIETQNPKQEKAILAGGCFWCIEAVFQDLKGVSKVRSGYIGGNVKSPSYREVCNGTTGHAEAVEILFNPDVISFETLLDIFWTVHDPTTLNQQGADKGTQYRSAIFYTNPAQKQTALKSITEKATKLWDDPIVTEVKPADIFYPAEDYHQNYYKNNSSQGYCQIVINPKLSKLRNKYPGLIKK